MLINDIDPKDFLEFVPEEGIIKLKDQRMLLFDAVALGLLRKELIDTFGHFAARSILTRFGYAHGWRTAELLRSEYPAIFSQDEGGSYLHMLFGLTRTCEFNHSDNLASGFSMQVCWDNSYEAEQHHLLFGVAEEPICWTLTGFASGYESCKQEREVYFIEDKCRGAGDPFCRIVGKFREDWGDELEAHQPFYSMESADTLLKGLTQKLKRTELDLKRQQEQLSLYNANLHNISGLVTRSNEMKRIVELARRIAKVDSSVVVSGESGVGKERVSRFIHDHSSRASGPFVAVNCGALTETLLESELFGHKKGAFTGADRDHIGLFEQANEGTLFLDEIGDISAAMQVKLLRALQEKEIRRVGDSQDRKVNVRIIAATHRNLSEEVKANRFRADLYYRLCVIELTIPPLRDRAEDILFIAKVILEQVNKDMNRNVTGFSPKASELLLSYGWPGNVRELQNVVERSVALCMGQEITVDDFPETMVQNPVLVSQLSTPTLSLEEMEMEYILSVLKSCGGSKTLAMEKLKIGKTTLYRKLNDYRKLSEGLATA